MKIKKWKLGSLIIIALLIGFIVGYGMGIQTAVSTILDKAQQFLFINGINLTVNENLIKQSLWQYRNNIGQCTYTV